MKPRKRGAFTLFQLLFVLAIFGVLLGLLLPAVQKVRDASSRVQSMNNLKQLALACHNYENTYQAFPPGNDGNNFSVVARLLPYVEQDNLFKQLDLTKPITDEPNATVRKTSVALFLDPQDSRRNVNDDYGATNYLFNAGSKPDLTDNDGIFFQDSKVGIAQITDGTSNTIMVGQTLKGDGSKQAVDVHRQHVLLDKDALKDIKDEAGVEEFKNNKHVAGDRCASWMDGRFLQGTFTATRGINDSRPDVSCDGLGGFSGLRLYGNGLNIALCDGSVRHIDATIKMETLKALSTRNGGEVIGNDF